MDATLRIQGPEGSRTVPLPVDGTVIVVGRGPAANVDLGDKRVSRRHLSLRLRGSVLVVDVMTDAKLPAMVPRGKLHPGQTGELQSGDTLVIGAFKLSFDTGDPSARPSSTHAPGRINDVERPMRETHAGFDDPSVPWAAPPSGSAPVDARLAPRPPAIESGARDADILREFIADAPTPPPVGALGALDPPPPRRGSRNGVKGDDGEEGRGLGDPLARPPISQVGLTPPSAAGEELDWGLDGHPPPATTRMPAPTARPEPTPAAAPPAPVGEAEIVRALSRGLGIELPGDVTAAEWECFGATIRKLVAGLQTLLQVRKSIKTKLGVDGVTEYAQANNNALKADLGVDKLIALMVRAPAGSKTFLSASDSIRQAVADLEVHDYAIVTAIREGLTGALRDFSPEQVKAKATGKEPVAGDVSKSSPFWVRAKLWSEYCELHERQAAYLADWIDTTLARHFVPAYSSATEKKGRDPDAT